MTAGQYIKDYLERRAPADMVKPWRHVNLLIRALWWKQARWIAEASLEGCARPSAEYDQAYDAMIDAGDKHRAVILDAWELRAMERGSASIERLAQTHEAA